MVSDTVVTIVSEDLLPEVLTQVHRAGLGQNARVLRPRRSSLRDQLRRAGIPVEQAPERIEDTACILMIMAAARSVMASELVLRHGASATWIVTRNGNWTMVDDHVIEETAVVTPTPRQNVPSVLMTDDLSSDAAEPI